MRKSRTGLLKKAIAVILGITMAFGALMLPEGMVKDQFTTASAAVMIETEYGAFRFNTHSTDNTADLAVVDTHGETIEIPSTIEYRDNVYTVTRVKKGILENDETVKTVIFPDTITYIESDVLSRSSVESITLSADLEHIGNDFASYCPNLRSVKCDSAKLKGEELGVHLFYGSFNSGLFNDKGAFCVGNTLFKYDPSETPSPLKIGDLGNNGVKVENIYAYATNDVRGMRTVDLEGVKYIADGNFNANDDLDTLLNDDSVEYISNNTFSMTRWYQKHINDDLIKVGKVIMYYKTDSDTLDLTSGKLAGVKHINQSALVECENLKTIRCTSDCKFDVFCFYESRDTSGEKGSLNDSLPRIPIYKIKNVFLDDKELKYTTLDDKSKNWLRENYNSFHSSEWFRDIIDAKTKDLFEQLDITYYGIYNDKVGTLSAEEEFYINLKIHDYMSIYEYDYGHDNIGGLEPFITLGKLNCGGYAELYCYLLECAGADSKYLASTVEGSHAWTEYKIGDEWFEGDAGWDAQSKHTYGWFALSSELVPKKDSKSHIIDKSYDTWHCKVNGNERVIAQRTLGDIDGDDDRDKDDLALLWAYVRDESDRISAKASDINFDGQTDVTDALLLDQFVNGTALDVENIPTDGMAPGFKVFFVDDDDYDNIHSAYTDRDGYITLPTDLFEAPTGKKLVYDIGRPGEKVKVHDPYQVITTKYLKPTDPGYDDPVSISDSSNPDSGSSQDTSSYPEKNKGVLGDVNNDGTIDIEDAVQVISHINGQKSLTNDEYARANVDRNSAVDIEDVVAIISHINGVRAIE